MLVTASAALGNLPACTPSLSKGIRVDIVNNQVQIPLSLFETSTLQVVSPRKFPYEIAVQKNEDQIFSSLLLRCTHMDNQVTPGKQGFFCTLHGSSFDLKGQVTGGPAERSLKSLRTEIQQQQIIVYL
jgi:Rieske Fe-S protein